MENNEQVIQKIQNLNRKELEKYLDQMVKDNNDILNNKEALIEMAKRFSKHGYYYKTVRDYLTKLGVNVSDELDKINREETLEFMNNNQELMDTLDIVTNWWIDAIRKPFFKNFDLKSASIDEEIFLKFPYNKAKVEEKNNRNLTEEKIEIFKKTLAFEVADKIRKEGKCRLWVDNVACWEINKCIDQADLRLKIELPKKVEMIITTNTISMIDDIGQKKVVFDNSKKNESNKVK